MLLIPDCIFCWISEVLLSTGTVGELLWRTWGSGFSHDMRQVDNFRAPRTITNYNPAGVRVLSLLLLPTKGCYSISSSKCWGSNPDSSKCLVLHNNCQTSGRLSFTSSQQCFQKYWWKSICCHHMKYQKCENMVEFLMFFCSMQESV